MNPLYANADQLCRMVIGAALAPAERVEQKENEDNEAQTYLWRTLLASGGRREAKYTSSPDALPVWKSPIQQVWPPALHRDPQTIAELLRDRGLGPTGASA